MLTESLKHLELSNNGEEGAVVRLKTPLLTDAPSSSEENTPIAPQLNEVEEVNDEIKSSAYRDPVCAYSGHCFYRKFLSKPAYCHHCGEVIWSPLSTGFACDGMHCCN